MLHVATILQQSWSGNTLPTQRIDRWQADLETMSYPARHADGQCGGLPDAVDQWFVQEYYPSCQIEARRFRAVRNSNFQCTDNFVQCLSRQITTWCSPPHLPQVSSFIQILRALLLQHQLRKRSPTSARTCCWTNQISAFARRTVYSGKVESDKDRRRIQ